MRISDWSSDVCSSDLLEAVDHAWVGHVPTVGLRVLLRLSGTCDVTLDEGVELAPLVQAQVVAAGLVDPGNGAEGLLDVIGGVGDGGDRKSTRLNSSH